MPKIPLARVRSFFNDMPQARTRYEHRTNLVVTVTANRVSETKVFKHHCKGPIGIIGALQLLTCGRAEFASEITQIRQRKVSPQRLSCYFPWTANSDQARARSFKCSKRRSPPRIEKAKLWLFDCEQCRHGIRCPNPGRCCRKIFRYLPKLWVVSFTDSQANEQTSSSLTTSMSR